MDEEVGYHTITHVLSMSKSPDRSAWRETGGPSLPSSKTFLNARASGWNLVHIASMKNTPFSFARVNRDLSSAAFKVTGFSHRTCFLARIASLEFW